jgi:hypothetical protein
MFIIIIHSSSNFHHFQLSSLIRAESSDAIRAITVVAAVRAAVVVVRVPSTATARSSRVLAAV